MNGMQYTDSEADEHTDTHRSSLSCQSSECDHPYRSPARHVDQLGPCTHIDGNSEQDSGALEISGKLTNL